MSSELVNFHRCARRFALATLLGLALGAAAFGGEQVTLGWKPSPAAVAGYYFYYGTSPGVYTRKIDVGTNTLYTVSALAAGVTYYFSVASYNAARIESDTVVEVSYLVPGFMAATRSPAAKTIAIRFPVGQGQAYQLQSSVNLLTWSNLWLTPTAPISGWVEYQEPQSDAVPSRFYRWIRP